MKRDDISMYDDPNESAFVRELLHAGRRANVGYDVESGLARHLAAIGAASASPVATGAAVAKAGLPAWLGFVAVPLAAAGVAGVLWAFSEPRAAEAPASQAPQAFHSEAARGSEGSTGLSMPAGVTPSAAPSPSAADENAVRERRIARSSSRASNGHASARVPSRAARAAAEPSAGTTVEATALDVEAADPSNAARSNDAAPMLAANPYASSRDSDRDRDHDRETKRVAEPVGSKATQAPAKAADEAEETTARPEPEVAATAAKPKSDQQPAAAPVIDESRLEREMQMLAVTQRVLATDPARALSLSQQGEREFRGSMLSAERRQLGLLALVKLGRLDEARRAGRPFLARYPKAPWSERLHRALVTGKVE